MLVNDPIADMLTRIRNAQVARHDVVLVPASNMKKSIAKILLAEGYVKNVEVIQDGPQGTIKITLKYVQGQGTRRSGAISGLKRISKPGLRVYAKAGDVPKVLGGLGVALVSTSQGVITDQEANRKSVGGEVLAYIW